MGIELSLLYRVTREAMFEYNPERSENIWEKYIPGQGKASTKAGQQRDYAVLLEWSRWEQRRLKKGKSRQVI